MQNSSFDLVFMSSHDSDRSLSEWFRMHDFEVHEVAVDDWLAAPQRFASTPLLLFVNQPAFESQRTQLALAQTRRPVLGVFGPRCDNLDVAIIREFTDFIRWPCADRELAWRLDRLQANDPPVASLDDATREALLKLNLVGQSSAFQVMINAITRIARSNAPTLLEGETGTGKELAARAIHYLGERRDAPFVPVNCGAIPDNILENELFGHERGAFTDARDARPGLVALAEGGTLFLDEIDTLSSKAQVALLRFLQDQQFRPLGSKRFIRADLRIVAATNADLNALVEEGKFRQDLLFRLNVLYLRLPALSERVEDIGLLARHFVQRLGVRYRQPNKYLHPSAIAELKRMPWKGNVRELENAIHRSFLRCDEDAVRLEVSSAPNDERRRTAVDRRWSGLANCEFAKTKARLIAEFERHYLHALLDAAGGNVSEAARRAGKERRTLGKLLKKYKIKF
ncbi:MAG: sigma-54 dependent transcriptional regulator [Gammaproteobacteria bacterium]|nr:sigma-54 dependent transcriptional regulator [Gammaproteobacteria bacterium]